jgi:hypothetical protein
LASRWSIIKSLVQLTLLFWSVINLVFLAGIATANSQTIPSHESIDGAQLSAPAEKPAGRHYIEFRVATIGTYGHSYVVYGIEGGKQNYADLHPMGGYAVMALGHVLPVPANTQWDPDVLKLPIASRYRRPLGADQYRKLLAAVQAAKANKSPYWNAITNNCNHFIGQLAQAIGLRVPGQFQVSYSFVPALKELNGDDKNGAASSRRRAAPTPQT